MREIVRRNIDELVRGIAALASNVESPAGNGLAVASGARASDDDGDVKHETRPPRHPAIPIGVPGSSRRPGLERTLAVSYRSLYPKTPCCPLYSAWPPALW